MPDSKPKQTYLKIGIDSTSVPLARPFDIGSVAVEREVLRKYPACSVKPKTPITTVKKETEKYEAKQV